MELYDNMKTFAMLILGISSVLQVHDNIVRRSIKDYPM